MSNGDMIFYRLSVQPFCADISAVKRQLGLEMALGSPSLAAIMGPDESIANEVKPPQTGLLCLSCFIKNPSVIALLESE